MRKNLKWLKPNRKPSIGEQRKIEKLQRIIKYGKEESRLNVRLTNDIYYQFYKKCFENRTTMSRQILIMIMNYLKEDESVSK